MLATPDLSGGLGRFLAERSFAVIAGRDANGRLWACALFDKPGFLSADEHGLSVHARPLSEDPLARLPIGQPLALIAIDFSTRRRVRVNGTLRSATDGLQIEVDQAFGNCPRYIQQREIHHPASAGTRVAGRYDWQQRPGEVTRSIQLADTFFLGTTHPTRGTDISHRGGPPGFVRVEGDALWWPDYPGNNMFTSLGNLAVDPDAALLFIDFATGATVQLSGSAQLELVTPGSAGDDGTTGRRVRFTPTDLITGPPLALGGERVGPSPNNLPIT
jgi:hypothetical protein